MTSESEISTQVALELSRQGSVSFRNNVGTAWQGEFTRLPDGSVLIKRARIVHFGLLEGSSDRIGYHSITVTPEMVGTRIAVFLAAECKTKRGRVSDKQQHFIDRVRSAGGIAFVARSAECVSRGISEWMRAMRSRSSD